MQLQIGVGAVALELEFGRCPVLRGGIAHDAHETRRIAVRDASHREPRGKDAAVLALRRDFAADADDLGDAGLQVARQIAIVRAAIGLGMSMLTFSPSSSSVR